MGDNYWKNWPKQNSEYVKDLMWAHKVGRHIIDKYKDKSSNKPKCVVFDIDDTLIMGDPEEVLGFTEIDYGVDNLFVLPWIEPMIRLVDYAKSNGFKVILLTARPLKSRAASIENMNMLRVPYDALIMNEGDEDLFFKVNTRRKIATKYDICLTVGDQITDVILSSTNTAFIKLPDPTSKATYAYMPPNL